MSKERRFKMRRKSLFTIFLVGAVITGTVLAQKTKDVPVTSAIAYEDANFAPLSLQSDLAGPYQNGVDSVVSQIQPALVR